MRAKCVCVCVCVAHVSVNVSVCVCVSVCVSVCVCLWLVCLILYVVGPLRERERETDTINVHNFLITVLHNCCMVCVYHWCSPEIVEMITSFYFFQKVTYVVGSTLVVNDLKKVLAAEAFGMFFLCNTEITTELAQQEDVCTVTRSLSVSNFNPNLSCFVQVLQPGEREILQDSGVEVILCLDEFKTSLMAKNAICPGISTFVENLFHSFGGLSAAQESSLDPWHQEYIHGVHMEIYYVALNAEFLTFIKNDFQAICDIIFNEYETIVDMKAEGHDNWKDFFETYNVVVVLADNNLVAETIANAINIPDAFTGLLDRVVALAEPDSKDKKRSYVTKYHNKHERKEKKQRSRPIINATMKFAARSTHLLRGSLLLRSFNKKGNEVSPLPSSDKEDDVSSEDGGDSSDSFESEEDEDDSYLGFTQPIRQQRQLQRHSLIRSGHARTRLPTKVYIDTHRSLTPYRPDLISHAAKTGESKNPLAHLKLGELMSTSATAGQMLQDAKNREEEGAVARASARRKSRVALTAVVSIVKMSRLLEAKELPSIGVGSGDLRTTSDLGDDVIKEEKEEEEEEDEEHAGGVEEEKREKEDNEATPQGKEETPHPNLSGSAAKGHINTLSHWQQQVTEKTKEEDTKDVAKKGKEKAKGPATLFLQNLKRRTAASQAIAPERQRQRQGEGVGEGGSTNTSSNSKCWCLCLCLCL